MNGGTPSRLVLDFARIEGRTRLTNVQQQPPWKMTRQFVNGQGEAVVLMQNISGGLLSGDSLTASVTIGENCHVQMTTTGSTRIYKTNDSGKRAEQEVRATVDRGALLEYLPDSIIPFAGSRYWQSSAFELANDAGLFAWEIIAPGRSGEAFAFRDVTIQTEISSSGVAIAVDSWCMQPALQNINDAARLMNFGYHATFYVCRAGVARREWLRWENAMMELTEALRSNKQVWGVSALHRDGLIFRGLATEGMYLLDSLIRFWRCMKSELYGGEAILPRKMY